MSLFPHVAPKSSRRQDRLAPFAATFAYDANLGFPVKDQAWGRFFAASKCGLRRFEDLDVMTRELEAHVFTACFLPAAYAYFLRNDPSYRGLASVTMSKTGASKRQIA